MVNSMDWLNYLECMCVLQLLQYSDHLSFTIYQEAGTYIDCN